MQNGMTSLHKASLEGHDEVVKLLCERYADVNSPDYVRHGADSSGISDGNVRVARSHCAAPGVL